MTVIYINAMLICQSQIAYNLHERNDWNLKFNINFTSEIIRNFNWKSLVSFDRYKNLLEHPLSRHFYNRNDREWNRTFSLLCWSQQKINQQNCVLRQKRKKVVFFSFAENFIWKFKSSKQLLYNTNQTGFVLSLCVNDRWSLNSFRLYSFLRININFYC